MATAARMDQSNIWWVFLLEGIAALIFGALLLTDPAATLVALAVFLGFYLLFVGVLELVRVFVDSSQPWLWSLIVGILGIVAGVVVLNHPVLTALALPTTVVIYLGVFSLVMGIAGNHRRLQRRRHRLVSARHFQPDHRRAVARIAADDSARRAVRVRHSAPDRRRGADRLCLPRQGLRREQALGGASYAVAQMPLSKGSRSSVERRPTSRPLVARKVSAAARPWSRSMQRNAHSALSLEE